MQTPPGPPPPPHPALVQAHAPPRYNPWAIVSVAFGASTILGTWCFGGLVAIITGHVARHQIKRTGEQGANLALIGLIAGYASIGITLILVLAYVAFIVFFITFATLHATPSPSPSPQ
jgi:hypothetical protein